MAQIVVDSAVMRDKASTIEEAAKKMQALFDEMLQEVESTANKMQGVVIDAERQQFQSMKASFETFSTDIKTYSTFLMQAADDYDAAESDSLMRAQEQGGIF